MRGGNRGLPSSSSGLRAAGRREGRDQVIDGSLIGPTPATGHRPPLAPGLCPTLTLHTRRDSLATGAGCPLLSPISGVPGPQQGQVRQGSVLQSCALPAWAPGCCQGPVGKSQDGSCCRFEEPTLSKCLCLALRAHLQPHGSGVGSLAQPRSVCTLGAQAGFPVPQSQPVVAAVQGTLSSSRAAQGRGSSQMPGVGPDLKVSQEA